MKNLYYYIITFFGGLGNGGMGWFGYRFVLNRRLGFFCLYRFAGIKIIIKFACSGHFYVLFFLRTASYVTVSASQRGAALPRGA